MKTIMENIKMEFNPELYQNLSDNKKTKKIYENSLELPDNLESKKIILEIKFKNVNNIPDTLFVYCFNPSSNIERETFEYFSFPKDKLLLLNQYPKSNTMTIDIYLDFNFRDFDMPGSYLINRIGFYIDNVKSNVSFNCKILQKLSATMTTQKLD